VRVALVASRGGAVFEAFELVSWPPLP